MGTEEFVICQFITSILYLQLGPLVDMVMLNKSIVQYSY